MDRPQIPLEPIAVSALQGLLANSDYSIAIENNPEEICAKAVEVAKGLRDELNKKGDHAPQIDYPE